MVRPVGPGSKRRLPVVTPTTATVGAGATAESLGNESHGLQKTTQRVIGIDLGTTNCCVAACSDGRITILDIDEYRCMPSVVGFTPETYTVGLEAKRSLHLNPANTIYDAKRLIGREYHESNVQEDLAKMNWPFKVVKNDRGAPVYSVQSLGVQQNIAPEQVAQLLLSKMKDVAEAFFGGPLDGAVITVPAYFNDAQRQATKNAARTAKIKVMDMGILNEPTAAGLAYSKQLYSGSDPSNVLVFDLGGGTFDVSVITIKGCVVDVRATDGDNHMGGEDFNNVIAQHFLKQIEERYSVNLRDPKLHKEDAHWDTPEGLVAAAQRALLRLRGASEKIKVALSDKEEETIRVDYLWPGQTRFAAILDRADFEEMNRPLFQRCMDCTLKVLRSAGLEPVAVDRVVLVGGSTRIPKIKSMLAEIFGQEKICDTINPDETVAWGAGVLAGSLAGLEKAVLLDVTNHPLGVAVEGDVLSIIAPRFQRVGTSKEKKYTTSRDNQTSLTFVVYEGENARASANKLLDTFTLTGIQPLEKGKASVVVTFRVNFDGTLSATAEDRTEGGSGRHVKKSLIVSSAREQNQIREQEEMEVQAAKLAASKLQKPDHERPVQYPSIFVQ